MPKMFNEGYIYHHLVVSLQGTGEGQILTNATTLNWILTPQKRS